MSQIKYLYISDTADSEPPLQNGEGIMVIDAEGAYYITSLICNELYNGEIYAPEINWYLKHTTEEADAKKEIFKALYEIRYIRHLNTSLKKYSKDVPRSVGFIGEGEEAEAFAVHASRFFELLHVKPEMLLNLSGELGDFRLHVKLENEEGELEECEKSVGQVIFLEKKEELTKQMGIESLADGEVEELIKRFRNRIGWYEYEEAIKYNPSLCGFEHKENPTCKACLSICPTLGLTYDESKKEIYFSHLDCINCGLCVSVCPSVAIDFSHFTQKAFSDVAKLCKDKTVLIVAEKYLKDLEKVELPQGILPLVVETEKFLTTLHLQKLLEEANRVVLYAPQSVLSKEERVFVVKNKEELEEAFSSITPKKEG